MLYAITDRRLYGAEEESRRIKLLELTSLWAANGVAFIQLREKDLPDRDQVELARAMQKILQPSAARLLINSRPDIAIAAGADGVHLPSGPESLNPEEVRAVFAARQNAAVDKGPFISVTCHNLEDIAAARQQQADCILFAPVFEKRIAAAVEETLPGTGLSMLAQACRAAAPIPVFALGGVSAENAQQCIDAGAVGVAAIRLMLEPPSSWLGLV